MTGRARRVEDPAERAELALAGLEAWAGGRREAVIGIEIDEISGCAIRQQPTRTPPRASPRKGDVAGARGGPDGKPAEAGIDDLAHLITRLRGKVLTGVANPPAAAFARRMGRAHRSRHTLAQQEQP